MATIPTTDQLRDDIDSGKTGEKVAFPDPAAAPLGTDAEAAGETPSRAERAMAARSQPRVATHGKPNGVLVYAALVLFVAIAGLLIAMQA